MSHTKVSAFLGVSVGIAAAAMVLAGPANAADRGVSIAAYCRAISPASYIYDAVNVNGRWDGWRCNTLHGPISVDVQAACNQQGGGKAVVVEDSANGWRCRT